MSFHFRLAPLLRLRESARDQRRSALAEAYRALDILRQRQAAVRREMDELSSDYRRANAPGSLDVDRLIRRHRHELALRANVQELARQETLICEEIERRREALAAADRDVRVLEKLRANQAQRHALEESRRETKQLDEIATRRFADRAEGLAEAKEASWAG
jgi:flagellar export protein FliJ